MNELSRERYRTAARGDAPAHLGWRSRRRWRKDDRKAARAHDRDEVRGWRDRDPSSLDPAGPVVLVVAIVIGALIWFLGGNDDDETAAPATSVGTSAAPSNSTAPTVGPSTRTPGEGELPGSDVADPTAPEPFATGPGGDVAHRFLLAWNEYTPNLPDPTGQWIASWSPLATDAVERYATAASAALWTSATTNAVAVLDPVVQPGATLDVGTDQAVYEAAVVRRLFPLGAAPGTPDTTETVRMRVVLTTDGTTWTVASAQVLTGAAEVDTPAGAGE